MGDECENNEIKQRAINISRNAYKKTQFDNEFKIEKNEEKNNCLKSSAKKLALKFHPKNILDIFTIFYSIAEYDFKKFLIADIFSGITVGIMHIPAALAYGALTSLSPVYGLYTSFYTGLTYIFFGTSRHLSVGTFAVTSIMVYSTIKRVESEFAEINQPFNLNETDLILNNETVIDEDKTLQFKLQISTCLAFWCGIFQILFSFLKLGSVSKYLSQPLLRGFTTAAAVHVLTTQLKHVLGIYFEHKKQRKVFNIFFAWLRTAERIPSINWAAFIFSVIAITFLVLGRIQINERFKKQLRNIPIPLELIMIISGTAVTYFAKLDEKYDLKIIGQIPTGLPPFTLPKFDLFFYVLPDAIIISIVAFATSISVADLYARKHKYKIDSNKEFFALGMANVVGSFFQSFVSCGALARSAVLDNSGGKTKLVTILASMVVLSVMLWFSALLKTLPMACLGSIIIAALVNLLKQVTDLPHLWKVDKYDFLTWIITFSSSVILNIDYGLLIGIITVLFLNTYRNQNMELKVLGRVKDFELHADLKKYNAKEYDSIKIVQPSLSIFYINSKLFRNELNSICPLDSFREKTICQQCQSNYGMSCKKSKQNEENDVRLEMSDVPGNELDKALIPDHNKKLNKFNHIIIDFENVQFVDQAGAKCLNEIVKEYKNEKINVIFTNCRDPVLDFFRKTNSKFDELIYLTVEDAITSIL